MSDLLYYEYISRLIKFLMNLKRWLLELDLNAQHSVIFFFFCKGNLVLTVIVHWYRLSILCVNIWFFFFFSHAMDLCLRTKNFLPFFFLKGCMVWSKQRHSEYIQILWYVLFHPEYFCNKYKKNACNFIFLLLSKCVYQILKFGLYWILSYKLISYL